MTSTETFADVGALEAQHCGKDALTDTLGWFLQGLLAGLAFTCLIGTYLAVSLILRCVKVHQR